MSAVEGVAHLAGLDITFNSDDGPILRQRCSWCGATLIDVNLARIAVPEGQDPTYPRWKVGTFIDTHSPDGRGGMWSVVDWEPGQPAPANACLRMPVEVTA